MKIYMPYSDHTKIPIIILVIRLHPTFNLIYACVSTFHLESMALSSLNFWQIGVLFFKSILFKISPMVNFVLLCKKIYIANFIKNDYCHEYSKRLRWIMKSIFCAPPMRNWIHNLCGFSSCERYRELIFADNDLKVIA